MPSTNMIKKYIFPVFAVAMYWLFNTTVVSAIESASAQCSPKATDLSELLTAHISSKAKPIPFEKIDNSTGVIGLMLSTYPRRPGDAEILSVGKKKDNPSMSASRHIVSREGKALVIQRKDGKPPFRFLDWATQNGPNDDAGDSESFMYAGPLGTSGYLKVDLFYGRDAPGFFLVNPKNGDVLLHSMSDTTSLSKDEKTLVVMNNGLNPPFSILIAALNKNGHSVDLRCQSAGNKAIIPFFTGWHGDPHVGFDLVLFVQLSDSAPSPRYEAIPVRFSKKDSGWHVFVPDPQSFANSSALTCWQ